MEGARCDPDFVVTLCLQITKGKQPFVVGVGGGPWLIPAKIEELQLKVREKKQNNKRLEAQRNDLNDQVRELREEIRGLQEGGSYIGEIIKPMGKDKILVKIKPDGKYIVKIDKKFLRINDPLVRISNPEKLKSLTFWEPRTSFSEMLSKTAQLH